MVTSLNCHLGFTLFGIIWDIDLPFHQDLSKKRKCIHFKKITLLPVGVLTAGDGDCGWACGHRNSVGN